MSLARAVRPRIQNALPLVICHLYSRKLQVLPKKVGNSRGKTGNSREKTGSSREKTGSSRGNLGNFRRNVPAPLIAWFVGRGSLLRATLHAPRLTLHAPRSKVSASFPYFCQTFKDLHEHWTKKVQVTESLVLGKLLPARRAGWPKATRSTALPPNPLSRRGVGSGRAWREETHARRKDR